MVARPGLNPSVAALPNGSTAMELIDWKRLRQIQPYSRAHIARLEAEGKTPKRVRLGQGRCAWVLQEWQDWIAARIHERDTGS